MASSSSLSESCIEEGGEGREEGGREEEGRKGGGGREERREEGRWEKQRQEKEGEKEGEKGRRDREERETQLVSCHSVSKHCSAIGGLPTIHHSLKVSSSSTILPLYSSICRVPRQLPAHEHSNV